MSVFMITTVVSVDRYLAFWVTSVCGGCNRKAKRQEEGGTRITWREEGRIHYLFLHLAYQVASIEVWFYLPF